MSIETGFPRILTINWRKWDRRSLIRERTLIKERALIRKSTVIVNRNVAKLVSQCSGSYSLSVRRSIFYRNSRMSLTARKTGRETTMSVTRGGKSNRPPRLHGHARMWIAYLPRWETEMNNDCFIAKLNEILEKADNFNYLFALLKLQCKHNVLIFVRKIGKDTFLRQTWSQSRSKACVEV